MTAMMSPSSINTISDHPLVARVLGDLDGVPADLTDALAAAAGDLRDATEHLHAIASRNADTAERLTAITDQLDIVSRDQYDDLRAQRAALAVDFTFAGDDMSRATTRHATALIAWVDIVLPVLSALGDGERLLTARSRLSGVLTLIRSSGTSSDDQVTNQAREVVQLADEIADLMPRGQDVLNAEQLVLGEVVETFEPVAEFHRSVDRRTGVPTWTWSGLTRQIERDGLLQLRANHVRSGGG